MTRSSLVLLPLLGACATTPFYAPGVGTLADDGVADIDTNLERLESLEIVEVGALVNGAAEQTGSCYGLCPGEAEAIAEEEARQAERLDTLVDVAEAVAARDWGEPSCDDTQLDADLDALDALRIVEVGALIVAEPENDANCYGLPCPDDVAAAEALTCRRADALHRIVIGTEGL